MKAAIGIDIGGTKISVVLGTSQGRVLLRRVLPTLKGSQSRAGVRLLIETLKDMIRASGLKQKDILGIGVGLPGAVDPEKGTVPRSPNLSGWRGIKLKALLKQALKIPVRMANDANAGMMAEKHFGAAQKARNGIYITVSTGIGAGILSQGRLLEGASGGAGEIGHTVIVAGGNRCHCGHRGCLEAYASGTAIARYVQSEKSKGRRSRVPRGKSPDAKTVGEAAKKGDALALEAYQLARNYLGIGVANMINALNPEIIVLGGGVWKSAPRIFWDAMMKSVRAHAWPEMARAARIVRSKLKGSIGDLGALAMALERYE